MAFTTGTATNHHDLLTKLKDYLVTQSWTVQEYSMPGSLTAQAVLDIEGPGDPTGEAINISIRTEANSGLNAYAWKFCASPEYDAAFNFAEQLKNSPVHYFLLWPNSMDYWFYVNDRRFIVVIKIGVYYLSMYAGFFLPYSLPDEYPYPYYLGASYGSLTVYNTANAGLRCFADPGYGSASYFQREKLDWQLVWNSNTGGAIDNPDKARSDTAFLWPKRSIKANTNGYSNNQDSGFFRYMRPLTSGTMPLWQTTIMDMNDLTMAGVLDGVFQVGGFNRSPEQLTTIGADDYRLFINVNRNTPNDYFAIREA